MKAPWWSTTRGDVMLALAYLVLFVACAAGAVGITAWEGVLSPITARPWWGLAASLPGVLGVGLRHHASRTALTLLVASTLTTAALGFSVGAFVFLFEFLFTLVLVVGPRGPRAARTVATGLSVALIGGTALSGAGLGAVLSSALVAAVALWLPVLWAGDLRLADRLRAAEAARADEAAAAAEARAALAVAQERQRMAGELHDGVSGHLSAITIQAQAAALTLDPELRTRVLGEIRAGSVEALAQMRALIEVLQAGLPQPEVTGALADLPALAQRARAAGHEVFLELPDGVRFPPAAEAAMFRAASEGLTNALKYAPGAPLTLRVRTGGNAVVLEVENGSAPQHGARTPESGAGSGPGSRGSGNGLGLGQLRSRVEGLSGSLVAGPTQGGGWLLKARVPLGPPADGHGAGAPGTAAPEAEPSPASPSNPANVTTAITAPNPKEGS
jgi:signal transduction histidine kinase